MNASITSFSCCLSLFLTIHTTTPSILDSWWNRNISCISPLNSVSLLYTNRVYVLCPYTVCIVYNVCVVYDSYVIYVVCCYMCFMFYLEYVFVWACISCPNRICCPVINLLQLFDIVAKHLSKCYHKSGLSMIMITHFLFFYLFSHQAE